MCALIVLLLALPLQVAARDMDLVGRWETQTKDDYYAGTLSSIMDLGADGHFRLELFGPEESGGEISRAIEALDGVVFTGKWDNTDSLLVIQIELKPEVAVFFALLVAGLQEDLTGEAVSPEELQEMIDQVKADMQAYVDETGNTLVPFMEVGYELSGDTLTFLEEDEPTVWTRTSRTAVRAVSWGQIKEGWK